MIEETFQKAMLKEMVPVQLKLNELKELCEKISTDELERMEALRENLEQVWGYYANKWLQEDLMSYASKRLLDILSMLDKQLDRARECVPENTMNFLEAALECVELIMEAIDRRYSILERRQHAKRL